MDVKLLTMTPNAFETVWTAIRTCQSRESPCELFSEARKDGALLHVRDKRYLTADRHLADMDMNDAVLAKRLALIRGCFRAKHLSVFEHVSVTYSVAGVSRTLLAQYSRHRIGVSLSVQSQRHVRITDSRMVVPPSIEANDDAYELFRNSVIAAHEAYETLIDTYHVPPEDARFIIPECEPTQFTTTLNLRSLSDLYDKRVRAKGAQWEIRNMVKRMADALTEKEPWLAFMFSDNSDIFSAADIQTEEIPAVRCDTAGE